MPKGENVELVMDGSPNGACPPRGLKAPVDGVGEMNRGGGEPMYIWSEAGCVGDRRPGGPSYPARVLKKSEAK